MTIASASLFLLPLLPIWLAVIHPDRQLRYIGQAVVLLLIAIGFLVLLFFLKRIENRVLNTDKVKTNPPAKKDANRSDLH